MSKYIKRNKKDKSKNKCLMSSQKELLNFFNNLLDTIFTENSNSNNNNNNNNNDNGDNDSVNDNDDNDDNDNSENEIKQINNYLKIIDESKSFEEQINLLKKMDYLDEW